jgi:hypothetical protein
MAKIKTTEFKKQCAVCGIDFIGKGPAAKLCEVHAEQARQDRRERERVAVALRRAESGKIKKPGVGKGGNPYIGDEHPAYKHGLYTFETLRLRIKAAVRYCERCGVDLQHARQHYWVVHHKDHNHWNHVRDNLELLCKRCHQIEHECYKNFVKGATTREKSRTPKRVEVP